MEYLNLDLTLIGRTSIEIELEETSRRPKKSPKSNQFGYIHMSIMNLGNVTVARYFH